MDRAFVFLLGVGFARLVGLAFISADDVVVVSDPTACLAVEGELAQCMHEINGMIRGEACVEEARRTGIMSCWPANHMVVPHHRVVDLFVLAEGREDVCAVDIVDEWLGVR